METFAYIHTAVQYEDPNPDSELRLPEGLAKVSATACMSVAGAVVAVSVLSGSPDQAMAATPVIGSGSSGAEVQAVQKALGIQVDGQYGSKTEAAVTDFQIRQGLKQIDGMVGAETTKALGLDEKYQPVGYVDTYYNVGVNVRSGPGLDYRVIGGGPDGVYLSEDYSETAYADGYRWTKLEEGPGWVATRYTYEGGEVPVSSYDPYYYDYSDNDGYEADVSYGDREVTVGWTGHKDGYVETNTGIGLNVRSGPGLEFSRIDGLPESDSVTIHGSVVAADGYYWQRTADGGWVATDYVTY